MEKTNTKIVAYYKAAKAADDAFQAALEAEFGPGANRFEIDRSKFTGAIEAALYAKTAADNMWLDVQRGIK